MSNSSVLLVDKASHRHKQDNKLDKESFTVNRIRADISDLMVAEIPLVKDSEKVVGVSKHLCGAATGKYYLMLIFKYLLYFYMNYHRFLI